MNRFGSLPSDANRTTPLEAATDRLSTGISRKRFMAMVLAMQLFGDKGQISRRELREKFTQLSGLPFQSVADCNADKKTRILMSF